MASAAEAKRQALLRKYFRYNPHMRPEPSDLKSSREQVAQIAATISGQKFLDREKKKKPTARVNKGGMYKGKKHTYAMTKKTKAKRSK